MKLEEISYAIKVLTPKDWSSDERGSFFEEFIANLLKKKGFQVTTRIAFTGSEIDVLAQQEIDGAQAFCECKIQQDTLASEVINKLIGKAIIKKVDYAILFSISEPGKQAKGVLEEIRQDGGKVRGLRSFRYYGADEILNQYTSIYSKPRVEDFPQLSANKVTLVVSPYPGNFWVVEDVQDGLPKNAYLIPTGKDVSFDSMVQLLIDNEMYVGLNFINGTSSKSEIDKQGISLVDEYISKPPMAESVDDYRPCRPDDFVGRPELQKAFWKHLDKVKDRKTDTRILAVIGQSGYGKSSIALRLANRFRNNSWTKKYYLFPIDVRTAKSPLFVAKALLEGVKAMIKDGFIDEPSTEITIESVESLLSSKSMQEVLSALQKTNKVFVLFFDQFEELFSKDELHNTFEKFLRLGNEVNSLQSNIVLAFSWRTGISLSENNPAYYMWHKSRDMRIDFSISEFTSAESSQLITQFEKYYDKKLIRPLRRRLLEQSQGMPWLLKKLCIHVFKGLVTSKSQEKFLETNLNIQELFDDDLSTLTVKETNCLKYIAKLSPADGNEILDKYENEVLQSLVEHRLLTRTGSKYTIYWDIFKEYLLSDKIPSIPMTYVPVSELSMIVNSLKNIAGGCNSPQSLVERMKYKPKTIINLITDLKNLLLIRASTDKLVLNEDIENLEPKQIAYHLFRQLSEHVITQGIYDEVSPGEIVTFDHLAKVIEKAYASVKLSSPTINVYSKKMVTWLLFAGLLEVNNQQLMRPSGRGNNFASLDLILPRRLGGYGDNLFLACSGPKQAIKLLEELMNGAINKVFVERRRLRNISYDLVSLKLAKWNDTSLVCATTKTDDPFVLVKNSALGSKFLKLASKIISENPSSDPQFIGTMISAQLGRNWSANSCIRYGNASKTWLSYFHKNDNQLNFF